MVEREDAAMDETIHYRKQHADDKVFWPGLLSPFGGLCKSKAQVFSDWAPFFAGMALNAILSRGFLGENSAEKAWEIAREMVKVGRAKGEL